MNKSYLRYSYKRVIRKRHCTPDPIYHCNREKLDITKTNARHAVSANQILLSSQNAEKLSVQVNYFNFCRWHRGRGETRGWKARRRHPWVRRTRGRWWRRFRRQRGSRRRRWCRSLIVVRQIDALDIFRCKRIEIEVTYNNTILSEKELDN